LGKIYDALEKSYPSGGDRSSESKATPRNTEDNAEAKGAVTPLPMLFKPTSHRLDRDLIAYFKPESVEAEQFRKLAANILFHHVENTGHCTLVTSATKGEGKSFLTANLAVSLAKSLEEPVLLIDCDLRMPRLHTLFGIGNVAGLSDHFIKGIDISALIQKTAVDNLSILPAGSQSFHSAELLSSKRMSRLIKTIKTLHKKRIILIDSPPPLSTAEPIAIARQVDDVILVINCGSTPRKLVEGLIETIGKEKLLGVVLNRIEKRFLAYSKYRSYGHEK
jgi:capsular exopolysaccharide synthesis family protein